jgi:hypothetical protein
MNNASTSNGAAVEEAVIDLRVQAEDIWREAVARGDLTMGRLAKDLMVTANRFNALRNNLPIPPRPTPPTPISAGRQRQLKAA